MAYKVRIQLIEGDKHFQQTFCDTVDACSEGLRYTIDRCDGKCILEHGACEEGAEYDIYVCGNPPSDSISVLEFIKAVKKKDPDATIFVLSDSGDSNLLKKIMKMNVEGFIDRDSLDVSALMREVQIASETYQKVSSMVQKLNRLASLKSVG